MYMQSDQPGCLPPMLTVKQSQLVHTSNLRSTNFVAMSDQACCRRMQAMAYRPNLPARNPVHSL